MKRLVVSPHDPSDFLGGTERVVQAMVAARLRRGEEVVMLAGTERFEGEGHVESRGEERLAIHKVVRGERETGEVFLRPGALAEFVRLLDGLRPDVVEWHHGATLSLDLVRAARRRGARTLMFLHDLWITCPRFFRIPPPGLQCPVGDDRRACAPCIEQDLPWDEPALRDWVRSFTDAARAELAAASVRIVPSRAHAEALAACFPNLRLDLRIVPHGLLDPEIPVPPPRPAATEPGKLRLATFGNLVPEKGLEDLAFALERLGDPSRVSWSLWGRELAPGFVERLRALAPRVHIVAHGPYGSFRDVALAIADCDLAAFPSRAPESYGLVVDEAFAARLPVLVSDRGALPERVGSAGRVLPARDAAAWSAEVQRLLEHPAEVAALRAAVAPAARTIENAIDEIDTGTDFVTGWSVR